MRYHVNAFVMMKIHLKGVSRSAKVADLVSLNLGQGQIFAMPMLRGLDQNPPKISFAKFHHQRLALIYQPVKQVV